MVKDTKYILKRIIIGVGIALILMLIKGSLIMNVEAQEVNAVPNDILIATGSGVTSYSPSTNTWNGQTVYALPSNMSYDWGAGVSLYFRYPQNSGATYCNFANNKATLSGRLYNGSTSSIGTPLVQFEDTTSGGYTRCSSQTTSNYVDFICNNINSSHGFNIQIGNAPNGRWGIVRQLNFECIQSGADITANINANNNQNTQNIINNQNNNTQSIINNNNANTDKILDDDTDNSEQLAQHNFSNFQLETHGLTAVVTAPLRFFSSLLNSTCTPLRFPLPFVNNEVVLPCLSPIYQQYFPTFLLLYRVITDGVIGYWVCIKIFQKMKAFLDPQDDKVEVFDL